MPYEEVSRHSMTNWGNQGWLIYEFSPAFVGSWPVDLRKRHINQSQVYGQLTAMVDQVVEMSSNYLTTWCRKEDLISTLE